MGGRKESKRQAGEEEEQGSGKARESIAGAASGVERPRTHASAYHHFLYMGCLIPSHHIVLPQLRELIARIIGYIA